MKNQQQSKNDLLLDRFIKQKKVSQSQIYQTYLIKNYINQQRYWIKIQQIISQNERSVLHEAFYYEEMQGFKGIPFFIWSGVISPNKYGLIIEKLGPSLYQLMLKKPQKRFEMDEIAIIGQKITTILQIIHNKNTLLNNIDFQTFHLGCGKSFDELYIFDLFYCSKYQPNKTLVHKQQRAISKDKKITAFMTYNQLLNLSTSRKDDMELMLYFLIFLNRGTLPWLDKSLKQQQKIKMMSEFIQSLRKGYFWQKEAQKLNQLNIKSSHISNIFFKSLQLKKISNHIHNLQFKQRPNYNLIRNCFKKLRLKSQNLQNQSLMCLYYQNYNKLQYNLAKQLTLTTFQDKQLLKEIYYPFQEQIIVDCLESKNQNLVQNHNNNCVRANKDNQNDFSNYQMFTPKKVNKNKNVKQKSHKCLLI